MMIMCLSKGVKIMAGRIRKKVASLVCVFVPYKQWRSAVREFIEKPEFIKRLKRYNLGRKMWAQERARIKSNHQYPHTLSVVAIMKDEGPYLQEWIEYHRIIGVDKFYLYNNGSTDDTAKILKPYVRAGVVELIDWPGEAQQLNAYADWLEKYKYDTKWAAIIDLDEYIVPIKHDSIIDVLDAQSPRMSQFIMHWMMFGSSGHNTKPDGLIIENYLMRAKKPHYHYKAIVNPRLVYGLHVHKHYPVKRTIYANIKDVQINHYFCKSWQEYSMRAGRGCAFHGQQAGEARYTRAFFDSRDTNDVKDTTICRFLPLLRQRVGKK